MDATIAAISRLTRDATADGPLLDAFIAGDENAFATLVRRHAGLVFATCRRVLRHQQDAEDAFQATFLVLARRAADVWPRDAVGSWLFGVAHRVSLKARSARNRRQGREQPLEDTAATEEAQADFDRADVVHRVVAKLPEVYRAAVVACDLQGLSRKEAAMRLGWTEGTLSGRLARARELLSKRLRRLGFAACGVAFTAPEVVSASLIQSTTNLATGIATIGISAPVAALTEGVVRSMGILKFKSMAAVVFAACTLGLGALAATGIGAGDGPGRPKDAPKVAKKADAPAKPVTTPPHAKPKSDLDWLHGKWHIVEFWQGDNQNHTNQDELWDVEVVGNTIRMPYREASGVWKRREFMIAMNDNDGPSPRTIELMASGKLTAKGIYQLTVKSPRCSRCHEDQPPKGGTDSYGVSNSIIARSQCPVTRNFSHTHAIRLVIGTTGKLPSGFASRKESDIELFLESEEVQLMGEMRRLKTALATTDPTAPNKLKLTSMTERLKIVEAKLNEYETREELQAAKLQVDYLRAKFARTEVQLEMSSKLLKDAEAKLTAAEKAVAEATKKQIVPGAASAETVFTIHVRTLTAAEKVIRVRATGKETVLAALVYAADDVSIKSDGVSVWVVRDKAVLPVDLVAITKDGETKTNYLLKAGDQLFVQAKAAK